MVDNQAEIPLIDKLYRPSLLGYLYHEDRQTVWPFFKRLESLARESNPRQIDGLHYHYQPRAKKSETFDSSLPLLDLPYTFLATLSDKKITENDPNPLVLPIDQSKATRAMSRVLANLSLANVGGIQWLDWIRKERADVPKSESISYMTTDKYGGSITHFRYRPISHAWIMSWQEFGDKLARPAGIARTSLAASLWTAIGSESPQTSVVYMGINIMDVPWIESPNDPRQLVTEPKRVLRPIFPTLNGPRVVRLVSGPEDKCQAFSDQVFELFGLNFDPKFPNFRPGISN